MAGAREGLGGRRVAVEEGEGLGLGGRVVGRPFIHQAPVTHRAFQMMAKCLAGVCGQGGCRDALEKGERNQERREILAWPVAAHTLPLSSRTGQATAAAGPCPRRARPSG